MAAKAIPIFMYHHVSPSPGLVTVAPDTFYEHMEVLYREGWQTVGLEDMARFLSGSKLEERTCILTFDDGYLDNYTYAHPIIEEFGLHAVLFLVTGWLGHGEVRKKLPDGVNHSECMKSIAAGCADNVMLRWSEVKAMRDAGTFEFHSHTHTHDRWDRHIADPAQRAHALLADLMASRQALTDRLGSVSDHLCWPQGFNDELYRQCAKDAGFRYLYTTERLTVTHKTNPYCIGRIVTKERPGTWLLNRANWFSSPWKADLYALLRNGG